jgi:hypothetical protein
MFPPSGLPCGLHDKNNSRERKMHLRPLCLAAAAAAVLAVPASAHHSFAMFDTDKTVELTGTVKDFQWTNPHSWLDIKVMDDGGKIQEWSFETNAPAALTRDGWAPKIVVSGDKITVKMHPRKDGTFGGQLVSVMLPDGKLLNTGKV